MDSYEQYERECAKVREENGKLLGDFEEWLAEKDLSARTINKHIFNVDFYINHFLLYYEATDPAVGVVSIDSFLGYWFIKKALWASKAQIKNNATSLKKFYQFMLEKGCVSAEEYSELKKTIKEEMPEWLATMDRFDDPDIEDMEEVWDL